MYRSLKVAGASLFAVSLAIAACQKSDEYRNTEQASQPAEMPAPAPAPAPVTPAPAPATPSSMQLTAKNNSGITGEVTQSRTNSDVVIAIMLHGAKDGVTYPAHIHSGDCASGGPVAAPLSSVKASGAMAQSSSTVPASKVPAKAFVQVHGANDKPVACVDLTSSTSTSTAPQQ